MKHFTHYTQLDIMDCGPTCLRMVAKHYGRNYTVQSLRDKAQIGKDGVSLLGIAEAAESIGFRTMGVKVSFDKLEEDVSLPCIIHWQQNHFVVVYAITASNSNWLNRVKGGRKTNVLPESKPEIILDRQSFSGNIELKFEKKDSDQLVNIGTRSRKRGTVYVADPARGLITYSIDEFCKNWLSTRSNRTTYTNHDELIYEEGIALLLEPTPAFFKQDDEKAGGDYGFSQVFGYLWQHKALLVQLMLALAVGSGLQLLFPFLTQSVVDIGVNTQNLSFIYLILGAQLMLMIGRLSVEFIRSWILLHISMRVNLNILSDFLLKLTHLPVSFFDTKHFGDIIQRIGDHHRIESFLTTQTLTVLFSLINVIIFGVVLAIYNLNIFGIFIGASGLYIAWVVLFLRQRRKLDFRRFDVSANSQSNLLQLIQGMQEIKLAGAERPMRWAWERLQVRLFQLQMKGLAMNQIQTAGTFAINEGKNILITFLAAQAVINGQLTLGAMLAVQYIIGQMNGPIEQLVGFTQGLQDAKISLERMNEIHSLTDEESADLVRAKQLPNNKSIQLQHLSFTYNGAGNESVLNNLNLMIPEGQTTAIVGMSGSGKTTLLKLLLRFYNPTKGGIRIGEIALINIGHALWRSQCGVVMQDGFIFSDTIARNIAVGVDRIDASRLDHAVHIANLRDFIDSLPSGLHTKIGAEGNGVSQGQKQRILIARAVYKDPQYLFFDEATNALDTKNEAVIMENLTDFFKGRTVIVVAHRLSTVFNADQIVVLDKGEIKEIGTHTELVSLRGYYWQLVRNQLELGS